MMPEGPIPDGLTRTLKEKVFFKGGRRRQRIASGLRVFDHQTSAISTGNVIGGTMSGVCIRPTATPFYPDGKRLAVPGQMREFDIAQLTPAPPAQVADFISRAADHSPCHAYAFFHHTRSGEMIVHGFIVTDEHHRFLRQFITPSRSMNSSFVLNFCAPYIAVCP
jgi:hypothetical protein